METMNVFMEEQSLRLSLSAVMGAISKSSVGFRGIF